MARFALRLLLDAGAGVCLWSVNDAARARFGYAVETDDLPISAGLKADVKDLIRAYDDGFDWSDPGAHADPPVTARFGYEADAPLRARIRNLLPRLRAALGPDFTIETDFDSSV